MRRKAVLVVLLTLLDRKEANVLNLHPDLALMMRMMNFQELQVLLFG